MIMDTDLRHRRIRDKVPMTFVTAEPYIGHLGVGGVGDTKGVLESEMRQRHIKWVVNAKVDKVDADKMHVSELDEDGKPKKTHELPFKFSMMIPAFRGIAAVRGIEGLTNPRGFIVVDKHQRNPKFPNVFGVGVCIAIAPLEQTAVPVGVPKTGYMIESMVTATALNIGQLVRGNEATHEATWNAICTCRFRRFRSGVRRHAAKSAAQRQLGIERALGPRRQGGVREILPAQGARRRDGTVLREARDANSRHRQDQAPGGVSKSGGQRNISGVEVPFDPGAERARRHGAAVARQFPSAAHEDHRRYRLDVIARGERGLGVGVDFGEAETRFEFLCRAFEHGRHGAARPAPGSPEIDQQRQIGSAGVAVKMRGVEIDRTSGK
jgi:hypothetical protein